MRAPRARRGLDLGAADLVVRFSFGTVVEISARPCAAAAATSWNRDLRAGPEAVGTSWRKSAHAPIWSARVGARGDYGRAC